VYLLIPPNLCCMLFIDNLPLLVRMDEGGHSGNHHAIFGINCFSYIVYNYNFNSPSPLASRSISLVYPAIAYVVFRSNGEGTGTGFKLKYWKGHSRVIPAPVSGKPSRPEYFFRNTSAGTFEYFPEKIILSQVSL